MVDVELSPIGTWILFGISIELVPLTKRMCIFLGTSSSDEIKSFELEVSLSLLNKSGALESTPNSLKSFLALSSFIDVSIFWVASWAKDSSSSLEVFSTIFSAW